MINTDSVAYGGRLSDLPEAVQYLTSKELCNPNFPFIMKDFIIDPIQIAFAAENGASGVVLIASMVW